MSVINNNDQSINKESDEKSYKSLYCLINDQSFHAECELLKRMSPKIGIRLRNSEYSRSIEQFCRWIDKLRLKIEHFPNNYNQITVNKLEQFGFCLYKISIISMKVFRLSKIWIELGQLINHFLMIIGLASRICIFIKAMMVYTYDIYNHHLHDDDDDKLIKLLNKMGIQAISTKMIDSGRKLSIVENNNDLGVPIDRKLFQSSSKSTTTTLQTNPIKTTKQMKTKQNFISVQIDDKGKKQQQNFGRKKLRKKVLRKLSMANKFTVMIESAL